MKNCCCIEIKKQDKKYQAAIHYNQNHIQIENLKLHPDDTLKIKGNEYPIKNLIKAMIKYDPKSLKIAYDERGQMEFGQYLFSQIFQNADKAFLQSLRNENFQLRIITKDEHITRLPWVLLADESGIFLSATGCAVTLSTRIENFVDYELPNNPKMLVAIPQPTDLNETGAERHIEKLEDMLSEADHRYYRDRNIKVVSTWEDFQEQVGCFKPDVVYYYGHGIGDADVSRLAFTAGNSRKRKNVSFTDMADLFRNVPDHLPCIVYLNCCSGDAGGLFGAGMQLGNLIPAVITNRTIAKIDAAQEQGLSFWRSTLLDGLSPHEALREMQYDIGRLDLSFGDTRWMTPVLHCHYDNWTAHPPKRINRLKHDPYWHLKLDRVNQFGNVFYLTNQMLRERKPRILAYTWYGTGGQGVDLFHHRMKVELDEKLTNTYLYEVRPDWPMELENPYRSFSDMMTEAFDEPSLDHIGPNIRKFSRGASGKHTLVYIRHQPLRSTKVMTLNNLKKYLEWLDLNFSQILPKQAFVLVGISYVVSSPKKFYNVLKKKKRIDDLHLEETVFHLLDELDKLAKKDLLDFLKAHNIRIPQRFQDKVIDDLLEETKGEYEMTLEALKELVDKAWDFSDEDGDDLSEDDEDEDFGADD
ncbi:CHAT domain-containing protein [Desulfobacterales bacterium HSG16]|nr:CHAT domain-containing protein [Desulfobacterales bacterium HSG16]